MTDYAYDPDLPYVVENRVVDKENPIARFRDAEDAEFMAESYGDLRVIDTTPKPRVPDDARWLTWYEAGNLFPHYARRTPGGTWLHDEGVEFDRVDDLPGVTPDTVFTVLDERKTDD